MKGHKSTSRWPLTLPQTLVVSVVSAGGVFIANTFGFVYYLVALVVVGLVALMIARRNKQRNR
jgi:apolipoprotein N-acyltransferase